MAKLTTPKGNVTKVKVGKNFATTRTNGGKAKPISKLQASRLVKVVQQRNISRKALGGSRRVITGAGFRSGTTRSSRAGGSKG